MKKTVPYKTRKVTIDQLLLDPTNYRLLDLPGFSKPRGDRYHESSVQDHVRDLLEADGSEELQALKDSIRVNGYIPIETLVLRPYARHNGKYVVLEGNRRVAAMKWLKRDVDAGVDVPKPVLQSFRKLAAVVIDPSKPDQELLHNILIGVRHVSGVRQWRGYQRAKLLSEMIDEQHLSLTEAAKHIGMPPREANRRIRAIHALQQMEQDEEFGSSATPEMYRLFHEAVGSPKIREWLNWDERTHTFRNERLREEFYRMLVSGSDQDDVDSTKISPKIRTYLDVRSLNEIIGNKDAEEILFDSDKSFADSLAIAKGSASADWLPKVQHAKRAISRLEVEQVKKLNAEEIAALKELKNTIEERLADWKRLTEKKRPRIKSTRVKARA